jgi:hypothetical protein
MQPTRRARCEVRWRPAARAARQRASAGCRRPNGGSRCTHPPHFTRVRSSTWRERALALSTMPSFPIHACKLGSCSLRRRSSTDHRRPGDLLPRLRHCSAASAAAQPRSRQRASLESAVHPPPARRLRVPSSGWSPGGGQEARLSAVLHKSGRHRVNGSPSSSVNHTLLASAVAVPNPSLSPSVQFAT